MRKIKRARLVVNNSLQNTKYLAPDVVWSVCVLCGIIEPEDNIIKESITIILAKMLGNHVLYYIPSQHM